jgi:CBS domain-containing protein
MSNQKLLVEDWMTGPVTVVQIGTPVLEAYNMMMERCVRRLPVVDGGKVVGIVTLGDLREARPSPATSLSIYELNYLLSKLTVGEVMTHTPYTVAPETPIQVAARIMLDRKVGGLPVVDAHSRPLGIITESDVFRMLTEKWDYFTGPHAEPTPAGAGLNGGIKVAAR